MRYKNKIDWWIALILILCVTMYLPLLPVVPQDEQWILLLSMGVTGVIVLPFFYGYVELTDDHILVRLSVLRQRIYYNDIKSITLKTNFLSSMAMTSKRVEIKTHKKGLLGTTFIGPVDREEFVDELKYRCHNLEDNAN